MAVALPPAGTVSVRADSVTAPAGMGREPAVSRRSRVSVTSAPPVLVYVTSRTCFGWSSPAGTTPKSALPVPTTAWVTARATSSRPAPCW